MSQLQGSCQDREFGILKAKDQQNKDLERKLKSDRREFYKSRSLSSQVAGHPMGPTSASKNCREKHVRKSLGRKHSRTYQVKPKGALEKPWLLAINTVKAFISEETTAL